MQIDRKFVDHVSVFAATYQILDVSGVEMLRNRINEVKLISVRMKNLKTLYYMIMVLNPAKG